MKSHEFASLLCSRLCHDLLSPVGALNNGIELLADETDPDMREKCLELLADSARASANKLKFFRLAFGAGGGFGEAIATDEAQAALDGVFGPERRIELGWMIGGDKLPKGAVKLLLNLALLAGDALVRGGRLDVGEAARRAERQAEEFELVGRGPRAFGEQFEAALAHFGIMLVGEQFDPVVERPDGGEQVVAQARAEQTGEFVGFHAA